MPSPSRLFALTLLAITVNAATIGIVPPTSQGVPDSTSNTQNLNGTETDNASIYSTADVVDQAAGPSDDTPPGQPVPETIVTANDGQLINVTVSNFVNSETPTRRSLEKRDPDFNGYYKVFGGTGPAGGSAKDAAIEGTAYLTYTVVSNSTYDVGDCISHCNSIPGCAFVNVYYEFNNYLLDFVFNEGSNLKCALYGDIYTAAQKTNAGGQQSYPTGGPLTYIQDSSGWATDFADPPTPRGYELVFGPPNGANNAPGYMGYTFIDRYDVNACAALCNARPHDPNGGACKYFNIWRALVNGVPTTYTCAFYYHPTDASTAVNYGQGDLEVTFSRGYRRRNLIVDGGFEGYQCDGTSFCYTESYASWTGTSASGGSLDATVISYAPYADAGSSVALLGSATGSDAIAGTLAPSQPLATVAGVDYTLSFFHNSAYSPSASETSAFVEVVWNGATVATITPGYSAWTHYSFQVTAAGNDELAFTGGQAPAWSFIDEVYLFES